MQQCAQEGWGRNPQGSALQEVREEEGGRSAHAHAGQLACGGVHGAVGQRPAGLPLGLAKHLRPNWIVHHGASPASVIAHPTQLICPISSL